MAITIQTTINHPTEPKTLAEAREIILSAAREAKEADRHDRVTIELDAASYHLTEPFSLSGVENPELSYVDITLKAKYQETAKIDSLVRLDGKRFVRREGTPYFTYEMDKDSEGKYPRFHDLHLNFHEIEMAVSPKWKNPDVLTAEEGNGEKIRRGFYAPLEIAKRVSEREIGMTELVMYIEWHFASVHLAGVDFSDTKDVDGETYVMLLGVPEEMEAFCRVCSKSLTLLNRDTFLRNAPAYIDEKEDTYAYDWQKGILYINPRDKVYMQYHAVEYPALETLFCLEEISNLTLDGVTFTGTTATYVCDNIYYAYQANRESQTGRPNAAAIYAKNMTGFTVNGCFFRDLGGSGILMTDKTRMLRVQNTVFDNIAMSALAVGNQTNDWATESNRNYALFVENNYFHHIGYDYPAAPCLYVGMVDGLKILHNTFNDTAYSAISVGWSWSPASFILGERVNIRNAEIAYNRIEKFMQLLKDGGAIYVLGGNADRYVFSERFNCMHDNFAIAEYFPYFTGKYGYYCDGASSHWEVRHSVMLNAPIIPIFSQPHPQALSYHNHFYDIYSNTAAHPSTNVAERDIVTEDFHLLEGDAEALLEAFPEAKAIRDAAGCCLTL